MNYNSLFPDLNFRKGLIQNYVFQNDLTRIIDDKITDEVFQWLSQVEHINLSCLYHDIENEKNYFSAIKSLVGIEHLSRLKSLDLVANQLIQVDLSKNLHLEDIDLMANELKIIALSYNHKIKRLNIKSNNNCQKIIFRDDNKMMEIYL